MVTYMRSNDAFIGLPHDVFAFTMVQEIVARSLNIKLGKYHHIVGSLHLYNTDRRKASAYVDEGWQPTRNSAMPKMPSGDPWKSIAVVLKAEETLRNGGEIDETALTVDPYWQDLIRLLKIFRYWKEKNYSKIKHERTQMASTVYDAYVQGKTASAQGKSK
jgi:thymidylate synthase